MPAFRLPRFPWLLSAATMFTNAVAGLVLLSACEPAAMAADESQPSKSATDQAATSAGKLTITDNPDGTFTVQKQPSNGNPKDTNAKEGLVIPPGRHTHFLDPREKTLVEENIGGRMNWFAISASVLSAVMLLSGAAQAMDIVQFDKMAGPDQDEYIAELIQGAEKVLTDEGKLDLSAQVSKLFTTRLGNDQISVGMTEFSINLVRARLADAERAAQNPNAHRLEVEDAMLVTLQKNNMPLSQDFVRGFRAINSNFKPKPAQKN